MESKKPSTPKVTLRGKLIQLFPAVHVLGALAIVVCWANESHWYHPLVLLGEIYLFPLVTFRIHNLLFPLKETRDFIPSGKYPPWWGSYHIQRSFIALPFLEALLRLLPGMYALWLRAWGSRVGKKVIFGPQIEIVDRSLMEIGDFSVLGQHSAYYCHVLNPRKDGRILLYVKKVRIGSRCFIGSGSRLGPGVSIPDGTKLDVLTDMYLNQKI